VPAAAVFFHEAAQLTVNGMLNGCLCGLLGVSFALILGVTGRFHFAFAIVFTATAYAAALLGEHVPYPVAMALALALALAATLGALAERVVYRPVAREAGELGLLSVFVASLGSLAFGEQKLVALARVLATEASGWSVSAWRCCAAPRVLLLDEPSLGLAPRLVEEILATLRELARAEGIAVALVEHDVPAALRLADRVCVVRAGRIVAREDAGELLARGPEAWWELY
jgi:ABC-type branched-subunit amino acid transport system ATPase component